MDVFLRLSGSDRIFLEKIALPHASSPPFFVIGDPDMADYYAILGLREIKAMPIEYERLCRNIGILGTEALHAVPEDRLKMHLNDAMIALRQVMEDEHNVQYLTTYMQIKKFLRGLRRAHMDVAQLRNLIDTSKHDVVRTTLASFMPAADGLSQPIVYSTKNTVTGRLTVESGPQILTTPAEVRSCIKSRHADGRILQFDIVSAEPKFALCFNGAHPPRDVYEHIAKFILRDAVTRQQAKSITLCALYGQSSARLKKKLPNEIDAKQVIRETRKYFMVDDLQARLRAENPPGFIRNAFGRMITLPSNSSHVMISYFLQSSVAEGALLMFSQFIEDSDLRCEPLFVIHDAMIMDCDAAAAKELESKGGIKLALGDWEFDVAIKRLGNS